MNDQTCIAIAACLISALIGAWSLVLLMHFAKGWAG